MGRDRRPRGARKSTLSGAPTEGGSGGKRGHSGMEHSVYTAEVKEATRRRRRAVDKEAVRSDLAELEEDTVPEPGTDPDAP